MRNVAGPVPLPSFRLSAQLRFRREPPDRTQGPNGMSRDTPRGCTGGSRTARRAWTQSQGCMGRLAGLGVDPCPHTRQNEDKKAESTVGIGMALSNSAMHRVGSESESSFQNHFPDWASLPASGDPGLGVYTDLASGSPDRFQPIHKNMGH